MAVSWLADKRKAPSAIGDNEPKPPAISGNEPSAIGDNEPPIAVSTATQTGNSLPIVVSTATQTDNRSHDWLMPYLERYGVDGFLHRVRSILLPF